jgi:hypothetical protein
MLPGMDGVRSPASSRPTLLRPVPRAPGADGEAAHVPRPIAQALGDSGNFAALGVYMLLLTLLAEGKAVTLDVLASYSPQEDPETIRSAVQDLFDLGMIPEIVAVDAGALKGAQEA